LDYVGAAERAGASNWGRDGEVTAGLFNRSLRFHATRLGRRDGIRFFSIRIHGSSEFLAEMPNKSSNPKRVFSSVWIL
jgi:hypothetical protein